MNGLHHGNISGLHHTEAIVGRPWSYQVTTTLNFEPIAKPEPLIQTQETISESLLPEISQSLLPEISILPAAHAEPEVIVDVWPTLSQETKTIINNIPSKIKAPNWFVNNNINWLLQGKISEAEFLRGYYDYVEKGTIILIDEPEPIVDQVSTNMIKQELLNFTIVNNRIQGSIKFTATDAFNPYYYNKTNYKLFTVKIY